MRYHLLKDQDALAEIMGERLVGSKRRVWINFQQPVLKAARGTAMKSKRGAVIDIAIDQNELDQLETLFHELAHVKLHYDKLRFIEDESQRSAPGSSDLTPSEVKNLGLDDEQDEIEASEQADKWMTWANENYKAQQGANEIEQRLYAMLDYFEIPADLSTENQEIFKTIYPKIRDWAIEKGLKVK